MCITIIKGEIYNFMKYYEYRKKYIWLEHSLEYIVSLIIIFGLPIWGSKILYIYAFLYFFRHTIIEFILMRCPKCNRRLGYKRSVCSHCKINLKEYFPEDYPDDS